MHRARPPLALAALLALAAVPREVAAGPTTLPPAPSTDEVARGARALVEQTVRLDRTLGALLDVAYAVTMLDPGALKHEFARVYGAVLADPILGPVLRNTVDQYRGGFVRVDAQVGASTDTDLPAAIGAAVDASYELPLCSVLRAGASGQLGHDGGDLLGAWSGTIGACLPLPGNTVQVAYTRRDNVRTTLLARPVVFTDRRTSDVVDLMIRFYRWNGPANQIDVMPFDIDIEHTRPSEDGGFGAWASQVEAAPARWRRRGKGLRGDDQVFEFMQVRATIFDDDGSTRYADAGRISPLTVDGIRLGPDAAVGLDVGWIHASAGERGTPSMRGTSLHADANLRLAGGPLLGELRATHTTVPMFDAQLVRESRLATRVEARDARRLARLEGFVARQTVRRDEPGGASVITGGGALDLAWALHPRLALTGRVEAARALVPVLATEPVRTRDEVRATLALTAQLGARWPKR